MQLEIAGVQSVIGSLFPFEFAFTRLCQYQQLGGESALGWTRKLTACVFSGLLVTIESETARDLVSLLLMRQLLRCRDLLCLGPVFACRPSWLIRHTGTGR